MKKILVASLSLLSFSSCNIFRYSGKGELTVERFKTEIPFLVEKDMAIVIPVGVGSDGETYRFHFDTHAPSTAYESDGRLAGYAGLKYLGSSSLKVRTTAGEKIDRKFYMLDSVFLGDVPVAGLSIVSMPASPASGGDTVYPKFDGLLGLNLMRNGVWKIDFERNLITFASSVDTLDNIGDKVLFAKSNLFDIFRTSVSLDGLDKTMAVDFGSNAFISLPLDDMEDMRNFPKAERKDGTRKTAAGLSSITSFRLYEEKAVINGDTFQVRVVGTKGQTKSVLGLNFFRQFRYVVIDYPGGELYVSGKNGTTEQATAGRLRKMP